MGEPTLKRVEKIMGMRVRLDIYTELPMVALLDHAAEEAFSWLRQVDALFSTLRADSQVSILDQGMLRPGQAPELVRQVLNTCARLHERTEGYFDVHTRGRLDPSKYVKGWAIQHASVLLTESGVTDHRLSAGDHVSTSGKPGTNRAWRVCIRSPVTGEKTTWTLTATSIGVTTCRNAHGKDRIHNPVTRYPASGLASVTVAGPDLGTASAYATAAVAMGPAALDWLPSLDHYSHLIIDDTGRRYTSGERSIVGHNEDVNERMPVGCARSPY